MITLMSFDDIKKSMNKSEITTAIFSDYSKAFGTIDFNALIQKCIHSTSLKTFYIGQGII